MRDIVVEKVIHADSDRPSLVDQIDSVLKEISFQLSKLADEEKEPGGVDAWVEGLRKQFWNRQVEVIDDQQRFRIRMAVPGFADGGMRLAISENGIEVSGGGGVLLRRIPLPERIDPRTVSAIFDKGYIQVAGAKFGPDDEIHLVKKTRKRRTTQAFHEAVQHRRKVGT